MIIWVVVYDYDGLSEWIRSQIVSELEIDS